VRTIHIYIYKADVLVNFQGDAVTSLVKLPIIISFNIDNKLSTL